MLFRSYALSRMLHGQTRYGTPSRFLEEIPENLIKNINTINFKNNVDQIEENYSQPTQQQHTWRIGDSVMHEKFGQGTVLGYEGNSDDLRIQIKFNKELLNKHFNDESLQKLKNAILSLFQQFHVVLENDFFEEIYYKCVADLITRGIINISELDKHVVK